ncbi:MAG: hypothetical protein KDC33_05235 [Thermoleophilia bacterium]|nr:hypothetical protein [Thermoleophilia bacterium]
MTAALARLRHPTTWSTPVRAWALSRLVVLAAAAAASLTFGEPRLGVDRLVPRWLAALGGWDTSWYLDIAQHGYDHYTDLAGAVYTNLPFFPLVPVVMKAGIALHVNPFVFALVVNNLAFLGALVGLRRLTAERFGERRADVVTWGTALFPPTVYASMAYTEAVTLALAVAAGYLAHRGRIGWAACVASAATLARPPGVLVAVLVALIAFDRGGPTAARARRAAVALVPAALTLGAYLAWMQLTRGAWNLPFVAQEAWKRGPLVVGVITYLPVEVGDSIRALARGDFYHWWVPVWRQSIGVAVYAWLLVRLYRMEGWRSPWVLYTAATFALPLASGSLTSMTRFGLLAYPLAWAGATWLEEGGRRRMRLWAGIGVVLLAVLTFEMLWYSP